MQMSASQLVFNRDLVAIEYEYLNCSMQIDSGEIITVTKDMVEMACNQLLNRCEQSKNTDVIMKH